MNDYYEYLMHELAQDILVFDDESTRAHELCVLLTLTGGHIPETFLRMYAFPLQIPDHILYSAVAYFAGGNELFIDCDCLEDKLLCPLHESNILRNSFFDLAQRHDEESHKFLVDTRKRISGLKEIME